MTLPLVLLEHLPCMFKKLLVMWRSAAFSVSENIAAISELIRSGQSSAQSSRSQRLLMKLCFQRERKDSLFSHFSPHISSILQEKVTAEVVVVIVIGVLWSSSSGVPPRHTGEGTRFVCT